MNRAEKRRQQKLAEKAAKLAGKTQSFSPQGLTTEQAVGLAVQHHNAGRLPEAEKIYRKVLKSNPNHHVVIHLLGVIAHQTGKNETAVELITRALALKPDYADAHNNLGISLKELGRRDEAMASYRKALALRPEYADAHNNLGAVLRDMGRLNDAEASLRKALTFRSDYAEAHINLANVFKDQGRLENAITSLRQVLTIRPDFAEAHSILGKLYKSTDRLDEAFKYHQRAVALNPENDLFWAGLADTLKVVSFTSVDENIWPVLLQLLERSTVRPADVVQPIISAIRHHPSFIQALETAGAGIVYAQVAQQLSELPLLLRIMALSSIFDLEIERMLTRLRTAMLCEAIAGKAEEKSLPFSAALALQCFTNEYVYSETAEEKTLVEQLEQKIEHLVKDHQDVSASLMAALGAYRPLYYYDWAKEVSKRNWTGEIRAVIEQQIQEPLQERALRLQIPQITPIQNTISQSVREQYEENPYPRWIRTYMQDKGRAIGTVLRGKPHQFDLGDYVSPKQPEILIAGCGTGQQILNATSQFANARVLAVDLSLSSLSYARRKITELGLASIEFAQADIMELESIDRQFDLIGCTGVLHHLGDPLAGWQVLVNLLRPQGLMKIALYSEIARQDIVVARQFIAEQGYSTSPEDIRRCRQDIIARAEAGDPRMAGIYKKRDFYSLSECRDLIFHVQEHRFSLPQIEKALKDLNLEFIGFEVSNQSTLNKLKEFQCGAGERLSLSRWHEFELENPDTFWGMYQFWCKKI